MNDRLYHLFLAGLVAIVVLVMINLMRPNMATNRYQAVQMVHGPQVEVYVLDQQTGDMYIVDSAAQKMNKIMK